MMVLLTRREQFHSNQIGESVSPYNPETQARIDQQTQNFINKGIGSTTAHNQAIASIGNIVRREPYVMAYNDGFLFVGLALLVSGFALLFTKKVKSGAGVAAH